MFRFFSFFVYNSFSLTTPIQSAASEPLHTRSHILEHLENVIEKTEDDMTEDELQLHYFKMHDYDNNNKLDGLELIQALTHFHHDDDEDDPQHKQEQPAMMSEKELVDLIDPIFEEEDENGDGYIDYPEFARSQS